MGKRVQRLINKKLWHGRERKDSILPLTLWIRNEVLQEQIPRLLKGAAGFSWTRTQASCLRSLFAVRAADGSGCWGALPEPRSLCRKVLPMAATWCIPRRFLSPCVYFLFLAGGTKEHNQKPAFSLGALQKEYNLTPSRSLIVSSGTFPIDGKKMG